MPTSSLPLFPTDEGWPYPDGAPELLAPDAIDAGEPDLDELDLRIDPHAYDQLDARERAVLFAHFGLGGSAVVATPELGRRLGCTDAEVAVLLEAAVDKVRRHLTTTA
jgi:hypothetical protein